MVWPKEKGVWPVQYPRRTWVQWPYKLGDLRLRPNRDTWAWALTTDLFRDRSWDMAWPDERYTATARAVSLVKLCTTAEWVDKHLSATAVFLSGAQYITCRSEATTQTSV